jgi:NAD(P)-dependent dehydrogenase (short-subunit alcohol dehydrogenase family)
MATTPGPPWWARLPRQDGRVVVVTGASSGLGLATTEHLVALGAHVVLAVREPARGEAAVRSLRPGLRGTTEVRRLDVSDLASVREFAAATGRVDVLVANAGVMAVPFAWSVDGHELQLATNHLGHFALSLLLMPRLGDRVVVVASSAHRRGRLDLDDLDWTRRGYRPAAAYAASKLANLLFMMELQRRLTAAGSRLRATGAHPGSTATGITGHTGSGALTRVGSFGHRLTGMPPWRGALTTVHAAVLDVPGNSYLGPSGRLLGRHGWPEPVARSAAPADPDLARELWKRSEELTGVVWPLEVS